MDYDRLRELQAKFDENPRRYFAPLANEYRKGGNPKRAVEICRAHLAQMPGHMSGQVVYGQSLFEGGEYEEARKVFEGALVLDPENLIALRSLGDLSLQAGNTTQARAWYTRLLEADPKDAAVTALISQIDALSDASPPASAETTPSSEPQAESEFTVDYSFVDPPPGAPSPAAPAMGERSTSRTSEPESSVEEAGAIDSQTESAEVQRDPPLGLEHNHPTEDTVPSPPELMGPDRDRGALDDWSPPTGAVVHEEESATPELWPSSGLPPAAEAPAPPVEAGASSFAGTNPEPFVNETMAQLYLQQGYRQLALRVYRQLSERRPHEQSLRDRIAEIEASQAAEADGAEPQARREEPPSIETPTPEPAPRAPSTESPLPYGPGSQPSSVESPGFDRSPVDSPPASSPAGDPDSIESPAREEPRAEPEGIAARQPSMREFFATLGRRRPPRPAPATGSWGRNESSAGSPVASDVAKPASLDAVFAGAKVNTTDARAATTLAGAFSASARGTSPPSPAATPTPRANPRLQTHESEEDVAKFRAWLDGLTGE